METWYAPIQYTPAGRAGQGLDVGYVVSDGKGRWAMEMKPTVQVQLAAGGGLDMGMTVDAFRDSLTAGHCKPLLGKKHAKGADRQLEDLRDGFHSSTFRVGTPYQAPDGDTVQDTLDRLMAELDAMNAEIEIPSE